VLKYSEESNYTFATAFHIPTYLFMSLVVAMFLGLTNSADEIIRDRHTLNRERNHNLRTFHYLSGKIFALAAVGFMAVLLIGPVVAIVAAIVSVVVAITASVLPFAVMGFVAWTCIQLVADRNHIARGKILRAARSLYRATLVLPTRICSWLCARGVRYGPAAWNEARHTVGCVVRGSSPAVRFALRGSCQCARVGRAGGADAGDDAHARHPGGWRRGGRVHCQRPPRPTMPA